MEHHIEEGREHLNFSKWVNLDKVKARHKIEECAEEVEEGEMRMKPYVMMHNEAKMTGEQKRALVEWFKSQRK